MSSVHRLYRSGVQAYFEEEPFYSSYVVDADDCTILRDPCARAA
ncbi:hypothetical protein PybrP1_007231, partial [[Pythium] brassicae (nom. inval.)]